MATIAPMKTMPLWRDSQQLLLLIEQAVRHYPRYHKYTLGTELRQQAMKICRLLARAYNDKAQRLRYVIQLNEVVDDLKIPITQGADFLGYIVRPYYCLVRRRVVGNLYEKLREFEKKLYPTPDLLCLRPTIRHQLQATLASYLGHFQHAHSVRLLQRLWRRFNWLAQLFHRQAYPLIPRWQAPQITSFRSQWLYFVQQWPGHLILIQLGGRCYAFNQDAQRLLQQSGYRLNKPPRTGFDASISVPFPVLYQRLRAQQIAYCLILEEGYLKGGLKQRLLVALFSPPGLLINQHEDSLC
jgi:hypothetical protein